MLPTANEALRDAFIRHQIYLLRYSSSIRNRINAFLDRTESAMYSRIRDQLEDVAGLTPSSVRKMNSLLKWIESTRSSAWDDATVLLLAEMAKLAEAEPVFAKGLFAVAAPVVLDMSLPSTTQLKAIVTSRPFEGRLLRDWAATMQAEDLRRISAAIQVGMIAGEGSGAIARRVIGTKAFANKDGATEMTRRNVQAITRTAVQHVANNARDEMFKENEDILKSELFVATLDARTTAICRAMDGKVFPVGKGPRPPLHMGCRSVRVAYFDVESVGFRPAKSSTTKQILSDFSKSQGIGTAKSRDELPYGLKTKYDAFARTSIRALTGRVPAATNYNAWLKTQTVEFQNEILGISKAKLFRAGLTLDKFVAANGTELTLDELSKKYSKIFEAAGL